MPTKIISVENVDNETIDLNCSYDEVTICPICGYALVPQPLSGYYIQDKPSMFEHDPRFRVHISFFCTRCRNVFSANYTAYRPSGSGSRSLQTTALAGLYPKTASTTHFSETVLNLSPMFGTVYNQAESAEASGLDQITGGGYRRALEFLVKDYLCHKFPDEAEAIKSELLSASISRIEDARVRTLASRSTWIGNDETHYIRKHEALDVEDMKRFITAMLHYIEAELAFEDALAIPFKK